MRNRQAPEEAGHLAGVYGDRGQEQIETGVKGLGIKIVIVKEQNLGRQTGGSALTGITGECATESMVHDGLIPLTEFGLTGGHATQLRRH